MTSFPSQIYQLAMLPWRTLSVMLNTIVNGPICVRLAQNHLLKNLHNFGPLLRCLFVWQLEHVHHTNVCLYLVSFANPGHGEWRLKKMWTVYLSIFLVIFFTSRSYENPPGHIVPWPIVTLWVLDLSASNCSLDIVSITFVTQWMRKIQQDSQYLMNGKDATGHLIS